MGQRVVRYTFDVLDAVLTGHADTTPALPADAHLDFVFQQNPEVTGWNRVLCCIWSSAEWESVPDGYAVPVLEAPAMVHR